MNFDPNKSSSDFVTLLYCLLQVFLDTCECLKLSDFTLARSANTPSPASSKQNFLSDAEAWFQAQLTSTELSSATQPGKRKGSKPRVREGWKTPSVPQVPADYLPSPFYACPELFGGSGYSVAGDLWSLGCVVFEMLVGRQPFCATSPRALRDAVCGSEVPTSIGADGQERDMGVWSQLVYNLLAKSTDHRCALIRDNCV